MLPLCCWSSSGDSPHRAADLWQQHQQQQQRQFICKHSAHVTPFGSPQLLPSAAFAFCYPCGQASQRNSLVQKIEVSYVAQRTTKSPKTSCNYNVRSTDEDCQLARYIVYIRLPRYCCLFSLQYRERDCSIQNTKYPFYLHISWGLSSSSTFARNGEKFHFLIYLFSLPTTRQEICRFFEGGSGLCLCVKVCTRDKTTAILSSYIFSRARFRHSGV